MTSRLFPVVIFLFSSSLSWAAAEPAEFRFARILDEFESKEVSRLLEGEHPEMKKKLEALRREVEALQK